jgi:hypothetical protein
MDAIGVFIATCHQMLGHDKTAAFLGEDPLDKYSCILCQFERGHATKDEVIARIGGKVAQ